ncbi:MAG TPA: endo-1,4-beta-xylanase [Solimonas sp.]
MRTVVRLLGALALALLGACGSSAPDGGDNAEPLPHTDAPPAPLRLAADRAGLRWGAAVSAQPLREDADYRALAAGQFNTLTTENALKFSVVQPAPGVYDFRDADLIAAFARAHGQKLRGHVLVWHNQLPDWLASGTFTRDELIALMRDYIHTVLGHFRRHHADVVLEWDVVNEAFEADGSRRPSIWQRVIGDDYVELAFRFAHEAWPGLPLYYNDFEENTFVILESKIALDGSPQLTRPSGIGATPLLSDCGLIPKCAAIRDLATTLVAAGVPIHGIGWQAHIASVAAPDYQKLSEWIEPLGLRWALTELDAPCPLGPLDDATCHALQAQTFASAARDCIESPACDTVIQWGVHDGYTWWPGLSFGLFGEALAFDADGQPKPAAAALLPLFEAAAR